MEYHVFYYFWQSGGGERERTVKHFAFIWANSLKLNSTVIFKSTETTLF